VSRHEIMAPVSSVYLMCGSQLTLVHFKDYGTEELMKTKLLRMRERLKCYIAVTFRFPELSVCGLGREREKM